MFHDIYFFSDSIQLGPYTHTLAICSLQILFLFLQLKFAKSFYCVVTIFFSCYVFAKFYFAKCTGGQETLFIFYHILFTCASVYNFIPLLITFLLNFIDKYNLLISFFLICYLIIILGIFHLVNLYCVIFYLNIL